MTVMCPVIFGGAPFVGEGSLTSLSSTGCSVACDRTVLAGSYVRLAVLLPGLHAPLRVELGRVQWVRDHTFGVEFIRLPTLGRRQFDHDAWNDLSMRLTSDARLSS
jgi:hypothetical protein